MEDRGDRFEDRDVCAASAKLPGALTDLAPGDHGLCDRPADRDLPEQAGRREVREDRFTPPTNASCHLGNSTRGGTWAVREDVERLRSDTRQAEQHRAQGAAREIVMSEDGGEYPSPRRRPPLSLLQRGAQDRCARPAPRCAPKLLAAATTQAPSPRRGQARDPSGSTHTCSMLVRPSGPRVIGRARQRSRPQRRATHTR